MVSKIRILVVEDSPTQAELQKHLLEGHGYDIAIACNGREALAAVEKDKPTVIISDILMPEMDGYELCRHIKKDARFKDIYFILLTVLSDPKNVIRGLECGADDFIIKPFKEQNLLDSVNHILAAKASGNKGGKELLELLIVEDSPTQADMLKHLLLGYGYKVMLAANGKEALDAMRLHKPAVVVSDILMPDMNGYELCQEIKRDKRLKDIPVILLTVLSTPEDIIRALDVEADAYVTKPYQEDYILSKIASVIKAHTKTTARRPDEDLELSYSGEHFVIQSDRKQILNFLLSIYDNALQQNRDMLNTQNELRTLNDQLKLKFHELEVAEERFETLIRTIPDIVYKIDPEGRFTFLNEAIQRLGYGPEELIGKHFSEIILPVQVQEVSSKYVLPDYVGKITGHQRAPKLFDERRIGDRRTIGLEVGLLSKSRDVLRSTVEPLGVEAVVVEVNSSGMYEISPETQDKKFIGTVGIIRDITERKKAEDTLYNVMLEAESANKAKSEFLANMSHELRTPLNAIIGFSEMMFEGMTGPITEKQKDYLGDIVGSSRHLLALINDILDLSKIEAGKTELEMVELNLKNLLQGSLVMFREKALKHNIKTTFDAGEGLEAVISDERRIRQVVFNLLGNAFKFTPDGGSVRISARKIEVAKMGSYELVEKNVTSQPLNFSNSDRDFIEISVEDTGIGMSKEEQERLFRPFEQIQNTLTRKYEGAGLGLHLSKRFVEMLGGRIWVESEKGKGSKFTFTLPAV